MDRRHALHGLLLGGTASLVGLARPLPAEARMPTLIVGPGMGLDEVRRRSSLPVSFQGLRDDSPLIVETPAELTLVVQGRGLDLGPTRLVWVNQLAGVVVELSAAPQDEALPLAAAHALAAALGPRLAAAGWSASPSGAETVRRLPTLDSLQRQWQGHVAEDGPFRRVLGEWRQGSVTLVMLLKQLEAPAGLPGAAGATPVFLVELTVGDDALEAEQRRRLRQRRAAARLPDGDKLPLSAWVPERP